MVDSEPGGRFGEELKRTRQWVDQFLNTYDGYFSDKSVWMTKEEKE